MPNAAESVLSIVINRKDVDKDVLCHGLNVAVITVIFGTEMFCVSASFSIGLREWILLY